MTMAAGKVAVIVVFVLSVFGGIWYSVVTALSKIGGWSSMANHFPAAGSVAANWPPPGDEYRFLSMTGSWGVYYKSCVTIVVSEEGLFLRPLYPFFNFLTLPCMYRGLRWQVSAKCRWVFLDGLRGRVYRLNSRERSLIQQDSLFSRARTLSKKYAGIYVFPVQADHRAR